MQRFRSIAYYGAPILLYLAVHAAGFRAWFLSDDFGWLAMRSQVHSSGDLFHALFSPMAQGTIRTLSERAYYMSLSSIFGLNPLPFHVMSFVVMCANLVLLARIARRLSGSRAVGLIAPVLWTVNAASGLTLGLVQLFNQVLCAFLILLALWFFLRYTETGNRRDYAAQWVCFVLGFGALEVMMMYPFIACAYALLCARRYLRPTLPMLAVSAVFAAAHVLFVPAMHRASYNMYFDSDLFHTLGRYWGLAVSGWPVEKRGGATVYLLITAAVTLLLAHFVVERFRNAQRAPLFLVLWFLLLIAPVLPLKAHMNHYYAIIPAAGVCVLLAWAMVWAWERGLAYKAFATAAAGLYLLVSTVNTEIGLRHYIGLSRSIEAIVYAAKRATSEHPGSQAVFAGITSEQFWWGFWDNPFRLYGIPRPLLAPGEESHIQKLEDISPWVTQLDTVLRGISDGRMVVLQAGNGAGAVRDVTGAYFDHLAAKLPMLARSVELADPVYARLLGPGWYEPENGMRAMAKRASVRMAGPPSAGEKLVLNGFCPSAASGEMELTVAADGQKLGSAAVESGRSFQIAVPAAAIQGRKSIELTLEASRTFHDARDPRERSVMLTSIELQ